MASANISNQTRPEKLEHPDFWARQRARMHDPAELRASAQRLGYWRPPPEPSVTHVMLEPDADRLLATGFLTGRQRRQDRHASWGSAGGLAAILVGVRALDGEAGGPLGVRAARNEGRTAAVSEQTTARGRLRSEPREAVRHRSVREK